MAKFKVRITEKLTRTVLVEAENSQKAEQIVTDAYEKSDIILDDRGFHGESSIIAEKIKDEEYKMLDRAFGLDIITESEEK